MDYSENERLSERCMEGGMAPGDEHRDGATKVSAIATHTSKQWTRSTFSNITSHHDSKVEHGEHSALAKAPSSRADSLQVSGENANHAQLTSSSMSPCTIDGRGVVRICSIIITDERVALSSLRSSVLPRVTP